MDVRIKDFFEGVDMPGQRNKQKAFLTFAFGGAPNYSGENMRAAHKHLVEKGLDETYSDDPNDLGNIQDYEQYLDELYKIYEQVHNVLEDKKYLVIICQNILDPNGVMVPFAWDLAKKLSKIFTLKQERIWLQDNKMLGSWGYPFRYVSNIICNINIFSFSIC